LHTKLQSNFHKHQANYPKSTSNSKNEVKIEEKSLKDEMHLFGVWGDCTRVWGVDKHPFEVEKVFCIFGPLFI
jgi:hypothetical protein